MILLLLPIVMAVNIWQCEEQTKKPYNFKDEQSKPGHRESNRNESTPVQFVHAHTKTRNTIQPVDLQVIT